MTYNVCTNHAVVFAATKRQILSRQKQWNDDNYTLTKDGASLLGVLYAAAQLFCFISKSGRSARMTIQKASLEEFGYAPKRLDCMLKVITLDRRCSRLALLVRMSSQW